MNLKNKIKYVNIQLKLFNYINQVDELMEKYLHNSSEISYKRISNLYRIINKLILHSESLKSSLILA